MSKDLAGPEQAIFKKGNLGEPNGNLGELWYVAQGPGWWP